MKLQSIYDKIGVVNLCVQVVGSIQTQTALSFFDFQDCIALRSVETETCHEIHTVGHNDRAVGSYSGESGKEIEVLCLHFKVKSPVACQAVRKVPQLTASTQKEGTGQFSRKAGDLHLLQITLRTGMDHQRSERISFLKSFG